MKMLTVKKKFRNKPFRKSGNNEKTKSMKEREVEYGVIWRKMRNLSKGTIFY